MHEPGGTAYRSVLGSSSTSGPGVCSVCQVCELTSVLMSVAHQGADQYTSLDTHTDMLAEGGQACS
jgi:hypothetical protein